MAHITILKPNNVNWAWCCHTLNSLKSLPLFLSTCYLGKSAKELKRIIGIMKDFTHIWKFIFTDCWCWARFFMFYTLCNVFFICRRFIRPFACIATQDFCFLSLVTICLGYRWRNMSPFQKKKKKSKKRVSSRSTFFEKTESKDSYHLLTTPVFQLTPPQPITHITAHTSHSSSLTKLKRRHT